jgi:hypothetical protein
LELSSPFGPQLLAALLAQESGEALEEDEDCPLGFYSNGGLDLLEGDFKFLEVAAKEGLGASETLLGNFEQVSKLWL